MNLFCFPHSGGSVSTYLNLFRSLDPRINLAGIELAGRNKRYAEPLRTSLNDTIQDLFIQILPLLLKGETYAFFGHSLGCLLIYELTQMIVKNGLPPPSHIFLSGGIPPHYSKNDSLVHALPDKDLLTKLVEMGGISDTFLRSQELQDIFLPIIRADYKMFELYVPNSEKFKFPCNVSVLAGSNDRISSCNIARKWSEYASKKLNFFTFEGDHFFVMENAAHLIRLIEDTLIRDI